MHTVHRFDLTDMITVLICTMQTWPSAKLLTFQYYGTSWFFFSVFLIMTFIVVYPFEYSYHYYFGDLIFVLEMPSHQM